jgi:acetylornithine deacetylase
MEKQEVTIRPQRLRKLLHRMIDIYSPSGKEGDLLGFLHNYINGRGLPVKRQEVDPHRHNLLVLPENQEIRLSFLGHIDTVTAYDLDHFACEEIEDRMQGLGAADMKSGCAAMIEAYVAFVEHEGCLPPAVLALVVGEEEEGDGALRLVEDYYFPWVIIGEPTDLRPCLSHYGYLEIQLRTRGRRKHASLAVRRENAVEMMLHLVMEIVGYLEEKRPDVVCNIRDLFSARSGFVVPDRCEAWLDLHFPPAVSPGEIVSDLEEIFLNHRERSSGIEADFRTLTIDAGYEIPVKGPAVNTLRSILESSGKGWEPEVFRSHSDANRIWGAGIKPILLGPGRLEQAHAPDEFVSFQEVCRASKIYLDILCAAASGRW